ncbi:hypothetical protein GP721_34965 [Enterobacteriaceae bacterium TzEc077]|nr:hypothetical protein GP721_34965 [Enterobacteriaceae bacterium TzEc077]
MFGTDPILGPVSFSLDANVIPWWVGGNNAANLVLPPSGTTIFEFSVVSLFPGFIQPLVGWFTRLIPNFSICVAGLGFSVIGPYGTVSLKTGQCWSHFDATRRQLI